MKKSHMINALIVILFFTLSGCAEIETPQPAQIIKNPIGPSAAKIGMTKSQVTSIYGDPDVKSAAIASDAWEEEREEWLYRARVDTLPVSADYLAEDLYLYFDGDRLTNISKTPLGTTKEDKKDAGKKDIIK